MCLKMEEESVVRSIWIFSSMGSVGDVVPLLAIAIEAKLRGHEVYFLTNENHRKLVEVEGISFRSIAPAELSQEHSLNEIYRSSVIPSYKVSYGFVEEKFKESAPMVIISSSECSGASFACEKFNIPFVRIILSPCIEWNLNNPIYPITEIKGKLVKCFTQYIVAPLLFWIHKRFKYPKKEINLFRKCVGLPLISSFSHMESLPRIRLRAYPDWFGERAYRDEECCIEIGFPFYKQNNCIAVSEFLTHKKKHGSPVVVIPGTGVRDVKNFFEVALEALKTLNIPGVFISNIAKQTLREVPLAQNILILDYVDLAQVLHEGLLLVHHGGIGSVARSIKSGVPQIICPIRFDQPDNASRVVRHGLGVSIKKKHFNRTAVVDAIQTVLSNDDMRIKVKMARKKIESECSAKKACDLIEKALSGS